MERVQLLKAVELFNGLTEEQLASIAEICQDAEFGENEVIFDQGDRADYVYIVSEGLVEVTVESGEAPRSVINLGRGMIFGEIGLIDQGRRSARVTSIQDDTRLYRISCDDFIGVCDSDTAIGYTVMRNMAADLSFKLRHRNLASV